MLRPDRPFSPASLLPPAPSADEMYPRPTSLAPATRTPLKELLSQYEGVISELSPAVHTTLQPGLSSEQLDDLQNQHGINLSADIRVLYSWKNGSSGHTSVFPFYRFVPLSEALEARTHFSKGPQNKSADVKEVYGDWLSFRYSWLCVLDNGCGDGYFYDPDRQKEASSFFHTFHDDVGYAFYPSVGNYVQQLLELHRLGCLTADEMGVSQRIDCGPDDERAFIARFGQWVE